VIRIRYSSELRPGLNGHAERLGRTTVVYLLPGLNPHERAAALRRLRQHGRMGIGPSLPSGQLALAQFADRVRMAFGQAGAIVRTHPAGSTLPVMAVSAAVAGFLVLSAVSIRIEHTPLATASARSAPAVTAMPGAQARGQASQPGAAPPGSPAHAVSRTRRGTSTSPGLSTAPTPVPGSSSSAPVTLSTTAATVPPPNPVSSPAPSSSPTGSASPSPSPSSSASAAAHPATSTGSSIQVCVSIGPFGGCLGL
jgi:hypothetical protein